MPITLNKKLLDWLLKNSASDNIIPYEKIPQDLSDTNLKGDLANLVEAGEVIMPVFMCFYARPLVDLSSDGHLTQQVLFDTTNLEPSYSATTFTGVFEAIRNRTKHNPITSKDLEFMFDIPGPAVRDMVRQFRRNGEPIIACGRGYFYATSKEEVDMLITDLKARRNSMDITIRAFENKFYSRGQKTLF